MKEGPHRISDEADVDLSLSANGRMYFQTAVFRRRNISGSVGFFADH